MSGQGRIRWRGSNGRGLRPLNSALAYYQLNREAVRSGPADLPFASINYSAAGVAYAIYRIACARGDRQLIALANAWVEKAFALSSHTKAYYGPGLGRDRSALVYRDSLYQGALGVALLARELDDPATAAMPLFEPVRFNVEVSK